MKYLFSLFFACISIITSSRAQVTGSFVVKGLIGNYYPVTFSDPSWGQNIATELELGRSNVHTDALWRGSIISKFRYHITNWGHGSSFMEADINQSFTNFVGGWKDVTGNNGSGKIIIWLRGGTTTYFYNASTTVAPVVYDGVANPLPYQETNGPQHTFKTLVDVYVNNQGVAVNSIYATGAGNNYFAGNVGVGTTSAGARLEVNGPAAITTFGNATRLGVSVGGSNTTTDYSGIDFLSSVSSSALAKARIATLSSSAGSYLQFGTSNNYSLGITNTAMTIDYNGNIFTNGKLAIGTTDLVKIGSYSLAVNGDAIFNKVRVKPFSSGWPDYVFTNNYNLLPLRELEKYIKKYNHLPDVPASADVEKNGLDVGDNQAVLLKKIEELTLYVIAQNKRLEKLENQNQQIQL